MVYMHTHVHVLLHVEYEIKLYNTNPLSIINNAVYIYYIFDEVHSPQAFVIPKSQ